MRNLKLTLMIKYKIQFHLLNAYKTKNVEENLLVSK